MSAEDAELNLRHVEPAAVLGSVVKLQAFAYLPSLIGPEGLVERSGFMDVQVVQYHPNLFCFWVSFIDQPPHLVGKVNHNHGAPFSHRHVPPVGQGLRAHKQVAGPITFIFIVKSFTSAAPGRDGSFLLCYQLLGSLVGIDDWPLGVVGFRIKVQHIFHTRHKVGAYLRYAPLLLLPWFEFIVSAPGGPFPERWSQPTPVSPPSQPAISKSSGCALRGQKCMQLPPSALLARPRPLIEGSLQTFFHQALAHTDDRRGANQQGIANLLVGKTFIGFTQDQGPFHPTGRRFATPGYPSNCSRSSWVEFTRYRLAGIPHTPAH